MSAYFFHFPSFTYTYPLFHVVCFTRFCFNAPCQFTPLLNLRSFILGLTPFGWLRYILR